jgi:hypothetical protein
MEAIEELVQLSESMRQASALLADEDVEESRRTSTFLNVVGLGNIVCFFFRSFYLFIYLFLHDHPFSTVTNTRIVIICDGGGSNTINNHCD